MRPLDISTRLLSDAVWRRILETSANRLLEKRQRFFELMASLETLRERAEYDTGSISTAPARAPYSLSHSLRPRRLLEVGTFIGKSTLALALGADDAGSGVDLHTCDMSNALELPRVGKCAIVQYPRTASSAMFAQRAGQGTGQPPFELLHVDGRLQNEDLAPLRSICAPDL